MNFNLILLALQNIYFAMWGYASKKQNIILEGVFFFLSKKNNLGQYQNIQKELLYTFKCKMFNYVNITEA